MKSQKSLHPQNSVQLFKLSEFIFFRVWKWLYFFSSRLDNLCNLMASFVIHLFSASARIRTEWPAFDMDIYFNVCICMYVSPYLGEMYYVHIYVYHS